RMVDEGDGTDHRRDVLDQRSADRQRRRTVRRHAPDGPFARARRGGARRVPRDQARASRLRTAGQAVLVSLREIQQADRRLRLRHRTRKQHEEYLNCVKGGGVGAGARRETGTPATSELVARVPEAASEQVESAVNAARKAFDTGPWRNSTAQA